jgi:hypothetical protein
MSSGWKFKGKEINRNNVEDSWYGFVYLITLTNPETLEKKYYIGKKNFYTMAKRPLGKKEIPTDKRLKTYKRVKTFTFEKYESSSSSVLELKEQGWLSEKSIIRICKTKGELTYFEVVYQIKCDVLRRNDFLNDNILGSFYRKHLIEKEEETI